MSIIWTIAEQALRTQMSATPAVISPPPRFGIYAAAGLLCTAGMVFALAGVYMGLAMYIAPAGAALGTAGAAFAAAGLMIATVQARRMIHKRRMASLPAADNMEAVNEALQMIVEELEEPVKAYPKTAMALAALAGLVAGHRIH